MKKALSTFLALTMGMTMLAGCGGSGSSVSQPAETPPSADEPVTIKWALWDMTETPYYQPLVDAFEAKNPNVKVEMVDVFGSDYSTVLTTQLAGGADDLDVITIKDIPSYANLINLGMLEPLNDWNTNNVDSYSGAIEQITINDKYYGVPFRSDFWLLFYNKDLFDAANVPYPTNDMTLDEYDAMARKLTHGSGTDKVYGCHYHTWHTASMLFGVLDGEHTILDGNYEFLKPYYERILNEQKDGICMDYATLKTTSTHYSGVFFNNQIATLNMGSWFIYDQLYRLQAGESKATNWGLAKYPHPEGVAPGTTLGTITSLGINSKSTHKQAAADFINFVCGEEGQKIIVQTGTIPAIRNETTMSYISSLEGFPQDQNSKDALIVDKTYLEMPLHEKIADVATVLAQAHDNIMTENVTIDEGIAEMNEGVAAILNG